MRHPSIAVSTIERTGSSMSLKGPKADLQPRVSNVCFSLDSGHSSTRRLSRLCANLGSGRLGSNHLACDSHQFAQTKRFAARQRGRSFISRETVERHCLPHRAWRCDCPELPEKSAGKDYIALPPLPRSGFLLGSPGRVSRKREYLPLRLETFGNSQPKKFDH